LQVGAVQSREGQQESVVGGNLKVAGCGLVLVEVEGRGKATVGLTGEVGYGISTRDVIRLPSALDRSGQFNQINHDRQVGAKVRGDVYSLIAGQHDHLRGDGNAAERRTAKKRQQKEPSKA
jgi:hypothetical protein